MVFALFALKFVGVSVVFIITTFIIISRMSFHGEKAEIEQLRSDIKGINPKISHEVIAQAIKFNQQIIVAKTYRSIWWSKPFYPAGWDTIDKIDISQFKYPTRNTLS